jgi:5-methylcytosine-specific restriction endonuclease McrA
MTYTPLRYNVYNSIDLTQDLSKKHYKSVLREVFSNECIYCGEPHSTEVPLTIDHVVPKSNGGGNYLNNLVLCCTRCNQSKGSKMFKKWYRRHPAFEQWRLDKVTKWIKSEYLLDYLDHVG